MLLFFTDVAQIHVKLSQNSTLIEIAVCNLYLFFSDLIDDHKKKSEEKGVFSHSSARPESMWVCKFSVKVLQLCHSL